MTTNINKITISISSSIKFELDRAKKEYYQNETQNDMIKDLIFRGLTSFNAEKEQKAG